MEQDLLMLDGIKNSRIYNVSSQETRLSVLSDRIALH